jgi:putative transposase
MVTPAQRREAVAHLMSAHRMSERRACRGAGVDRPLVRYRSRKADDRALRERLKALARARGRFGYRRLHVLQRREGWAVNKKRVQRIYREERLMVRRRGGRKRALGLRAQMAAPDRPNSCWSLDFVHDQMTDGRRFRILGSSTNARASASRLYPTRRSPAPASRASWIGSSPGADVPRLYCPTTARS